MACVMALAQKAPGPAPVSHPDRKGLIKIRGGGGSAAWMHRLLIRLEKI
jgi:hypothetical protein